MNIKSLFKSISLFSGGAKDTTAVDITEKGAREILGESCGPAANAFMSWTYIAIDRNSRKLSEAPAILSTPSPLETINTYKSARIKKSKNIEDYVDVIDRTHPVVSLLAKPNNIQSRRAFDYMVYVDLQFHGAAFILKLRNAGGNIVGLQLLDPARCNLTFDKESFSVNVKYTEAKKTRTIESEDIIPVLITPLDMLAPYSPIQAAYFDLALSNTKAAIDKNTVSNYSRPDVLLAIKGAKKEMLDRITAALESKLKGPRNAGGVVAFDSEKMDLQTLDRPAMNVGDNTDFAKKICAYFGFPYAKIDSVASNRASMETVENAWLNDIRFYSNIYSDALTEHLLPEFEALEEGSLIYFEDLSIPNREFELKKATELYKNGIITRATAKTELGYEPDDNDEIYSNTKSPIDSAIEESIQNNIQGVENGE